MIDVMRDFPATSGSGRPAAGSGGTSGGMSAGAAGNVAIVVYDGVGMFELGVACDVFGSNDLADLGLPWYRLFICGAGGAPVAADGGLRIHPPFGLERTRRVDTVVVLPTDRLDEVPTEVFDALRRAHARGCRIISLCTGAFVLAEAGLLEGRRATTHWTECDDLARTYTDVRVDPGVLYVDDGDILTSAGSAASIDLCLHVVRCDYGSEVATQLARQLVVPPQRDGGQAQYIDAPLPTLDSSSLFADTIAWAQGHLDEPLTVSDLAARSAMSPRTFARQFVAVTGTTPHQWLQRQRVHLAQRLLETTDLSVESVAVGSGFCTAGNLRKHFNRIMHTSPQAYRRTFALRAG
jgi:AraC family transcriptional regulator, transcriptional activator FtrA